MRRIGLVAVGLLALCVALAALVLVPSSALPPTGQDAAEPDGDHGDERGGVTTPRQRRGGPDLDGSGRDGRSSTPRCNVADRAGRDASDVGTAGETSLSRVVVLTRFGEHPVEGASFRVTVEDERGRPTVLAALTNAEGPARIELPPGEAHGVVRKAGFLVAEALLHRGRKPWRVLLEPAPALRGRVVHAGTKEPVVGARVLAWSRSGSSYAYDAEQVADAEGRFEFAGIPGEHSAWIGAKAPGYLSTSVVVGPQDRGDELALQLGGGSTLVGLVRTQAGDPVPRAAVSVIGAADTGRMERVSARFRTSRLTSDANGRFELRGLRAAAPVFVHAETRRGESGRSGMVEATQPGESVTAEVVVRAPGSLTVEVVWPESEKTRRSWRRAEARLRLRPTGEHSTGDRNATVKIDEPVADFGGLPSGAYQLTLNADGYVSEIRDVLVAAGPPLKVEFALRTGLRITGKVVDAAGDPIRASVTYSWESADGLDGSVEQSCNSSGEFTLSGLTDGDGYFEVAKSGYLPVAREDVRAGDEGLMIVMQRMTRIRGRIATAERGTRLEIGVLHPDGDLIDQRTVWATPKFDVSLDPAPAGSSIFVAARDRAPFVVTGRDLSAGADVDLGTVTLPPSLTVTGVVTNAAGEPVADAAIALIEEWGTRRATSDARGRFSLRAMPPMRVRVEVSVGGSRLLVAEVDPRSDGGAELTLPPFGRARVNLLFGEVAVPYASLWIVPLDAGGQRDEYNAWEIHTDRTGVARFTAEPGGYAVEPRAQLGTEAAIGSWRVDVSESDTASIELQLDGD